MPGQCELRDSATERRLPIVLFSKQKEKLKGCGKSAPGVWQQRLQGKPHPEQNQIGTVSCVAPLLSGLVA